LRWRDIDFDARKLQVERSLEQTKAGLRFKAPKTRNGRRRIALPAYIVTELRSAWRAQRELRRRAKAWKGRSGGACIPPRGRLFFNSQLGYNRMAAQRNRPEVTQGPFHALRHTHAAQLIASGMDVLSISRRIGHASPSITLNVYGHLVSASDDRATAVLENAYAGRFRE